MRLTNLACTLLLVFGFTYTNLFSQFKVNPKIELNILLEDGCQNFPRKITFVGNSDAFLLCPHFSSLTGFCFEF